MSDEKDYFLDWGEISDTLDNIKKAIGKRDLAKESEAQTRFDVIDRLIREILQWKYGQIRVEEPNSGPKKGIVDYILRSGDYTIIIEAKKIGSSFPSPTKANKLKLTGSILTEGDIGNAISQVEEYAIGKKADVVVVTNGLCWCFYPFEEAMERDLVYAKILFPFSSVTDAESLFGILGCLNVENNSLTELSSEKPFNEVNKILQVVHDADSRLDRNQIADLISPALDLALYSENIISDADKLKVCFVNTEARTKFDSILKVHIADNKPEILEGARRLKRNKSAVDLEKLIRSKKSISSPPVTLIIGPVGAGKSTYLRNFELVEAEELIENSDCHWIYIDFEEMSASGNPKDFIYSKLNDYLLEEHIRNPTDYDSLIGPAYEHEISALARGPYKNIFLDKDKFKAEVHELIKSDYTKVIPYVLKVYKHLSENRTCVIVFDNIDLYEDEKLETEVFSEAIAIAKNIKTHILMSIRDTTYVNHRNDSVFNAFELKKLWLDPPPFKEVLSKRLSYSRKILQDKKEELVLKNGMRLQIPDLGAFFEIVRSSLLDDKNGKFLECLSDKNIRKGITLVRNFFYSGHVNADKALKNYINNDEYYKFPFHEVFKGSLLGQWKYFKAERSDAYNLFNSGYDCISLLLIRLQMLRFLSLCSQVEKTVKVTVKELLEHFSHLGASGHVIIDCLSTLADHALIHESQSSQVTSASSVSLTMTGAYYSSTLCKKFVYAEAMLYDTSILDVKYWDLLVDNTTKVENEYSTIERLRHRKVRMINYLDYLIDVESTSLKDLPQGGKLAQMEEIKKKAIQIFTTGLMKFERKLNRQ